MTIAINCINPVDPNGEDCQTGELTNHLLKEEMVASSLDQLHERAIKYAQAGVSENFLDLGKVLRQIRDHAEGAEQFKTTYEACGLSRRHAYYLVSISETWDGQGVPRTKLEEIGFTKLFMLAKHVTKENRAELLDAAETMTTAQLTKHLAGGKPLVDARIVVFRLSKAQYKEFEAGALAMGAQHHPKRAGSLVGVEQAMLKALKLAKSKV